MNNITDSQLPMNKPEIYCYTIYGFLFSIVQEKDMPWIYSNFIQIMYHEDWQMPVFEDHLNILQDCPFIQSYILNFKGNDDDYIKTIINAIDNNYYCYLFLDWYYINDNYHGDHFAHSAIITGYNTLDKSFTIYDNFDNGKFIKKVVSFENTAKAFFSSKNSSTGNKNDNDQSDVFSYLRDITFMKYNNCVYNKLDRKNIVFQIENYLKSEHTIINLIDNRSTYGLNVYKTLIEKLNDIDFGMLRDFHLIYEHKYLMYKRLNYVLEKGKYDDLIKSYGDFLHKFLALRNLYIKSRISKTNQIQIEKIKNKLLFLAQEDKNFMQQILAAVKQGR